MVITTTMAWLKCSKAHNNIYKIYNRTIYSSSSNQNSTTISSPCLRISNYSNRNSSTGRERPVGVRGKLSVAKYNRMPYSILYKHYIVAHHYYRSHNMARHSYKLKCSYTQMVGNANQSIFFYYKKKMASLNIEDFHATNVKLYITKFIARLSLVYIT